ncbi:hypothetical protein SeMB42_g00342 [Synchytrium endobioticum]|uniref:Uncharacterized protein n=1 Tax=Synchytrium endobioticum TaxID=286115 RepID=A0A507DRE1_9FUNG|nr:hypothetical protein SeMB42_g00342 [Synchytrium endobioticum]
MYLVPFFRERKATGPSHPSNAVLFIIIFYCPVFWFTWFVYCECGIKFAMTTAVPAAITEPCCVVAVLDTIIRQIQNCDTICIETLYYVIYINLRRLLRCFTVHGNGGLVQTDWQVCWRMQDVLKHTIVSLCIQLGIAKHAPTVCDRGYNAARNILYCFLYERAFAERPRPFKRGTITEIRRVLNPGQVLFNADEVSEIFAAPLHFFLDSTNRGTQEFGGLIPAASNRSEEIPPL